MTIKSDLQLSLLDRDEALRRVAENSQPWFDRAMAELRVAKLPPYVTGEDIRLQLKIEPPHHHNAWGALIAGAIREGLIEPTGKWVHMRIRTSHARRNPIYKWMR